MYGSRSQGCAPRSAAALEAKEGLALLNGTSMMTGIAAIVLERPNTSFIRRPCGRTYRGGPPRLARVLPSCDPAGQTSPRPIGGSTALAVLAGQFRHYYSLGALHKSAAAASAAGARWPRIELPQALQSPYSLRCAPHGLGPMLETLMQARRVVEREANSANDNPLVDRAANSITAATSTAGTLPEQSMA